MSEIDPYYMSAKEIIKLITDGEIELSDAFHHRDTEIIYRTCMKRFKEIKRVTDDTWLLVQKINEDNHKMKNLLVGVHERVSK